MYNTTPMQYLDHTFETPEENLACDEAILDLCEEGMGPEILRFWEPRSYFVVAGYSNKISSEVHVEECKKQGIPILRRPSGGGTVLQGPGCLNYSLILKIEQRKEFETIRSATCFIMETHAKALESIACHFEAEGREIPRQRDLSSQKTLLEMTSKIQVQGTSDLTFNGLKFSGNAQRRKRTAFLFHGTFLLDFDLPMIEKTLAMPSRRPPYRKERSHKEFLTNLSISSNHIRKALAKTWRAEEKFGNEFLPLDQIRNLVREKYSRREWNFKF